MAPKISIKAVKEFAKGAPWAKIFKKAENTERGQRVYPSMSAKNDAKTNFRFDKGSKVGEKHELIFQANSNASDPGVKAEAAKNSHKIWGKVVFDPKNPSASQAEQDLLDSFKENK
jgi:hypothetical protein